MQKSGVICIMLYKDRSLLKQMVTSKDGYRKTNAGWEAEGLYQGANDRDDKNWSDKAKSLNIGQTRFSNWLDMGQERKRSRVSLLTAQNQVLSS